MPDAQTPTWFGELWPRVAIASGVGYLATAYAVSRWLTRRSPAAVARPIIANCKGEELYCQTEDGIDLRGWCVEPPVPRATVALFHGMRHNRATLVERIAFLTSAGYRCVAFDHRAHGESGGRYCTFGYHERHDVIAVLDFIRRAWPREPRAAIGISMGAAAICFAGGGAQGFDAFVLESVYGDLARAFDQRVGCGYPSWFRYFRQGIVWFTEFRMGQRIEAVSPRAHIRSLAPRPILLLTGSEDPHAPPEDVRVLADQIPAEVQYHVIPGAAHTNVCALGGEHYRELLLGFLRRSLFAGALPAAA